MVSLPHFPQQLVDRLVLSVLLLPTQYQVLSVPLQVQPVPVQ
jgi:hypothetical protein